MLKLEIISMIISVISVFITSIIGTTSYKSYKRGKLIDIIKSYLELEREADNLIFSLLIDKDFLNKLFYEKSQLSPPDINTPLENMTQEQRAILNFAVIILDYFEQLVILDKYKVFPKEIKSTWEPWIEECTKAPYFIWAWEKLHKHYHPELSEIINKFRMKSKIGNDENFTQ